MRLLWICNQMPPVVAEYKGLASSVKEGWVSAILEQLLRHGKQQEIILGICYPVAAGQSCDFAEKIPVRLGDAEISILTYGFFEDVTKPEQYDAGIEQQLTTVFRDFKPDVIHCFGTEYPHTLAALKTAGDPSRVLVGLQGLCFALAQVYTTGLPENVCKRFLLRDFLKQDNILQQQKKFEKRGEMELCTLKLARNVTGRTEWDNRMVHAQNPELTYYSMNETLRRPFYTGTWELEKCRKHSIFLSQGDYPIKGLHFVLEALPAILKVYPDTKVYVAGQSIIGYDTLKQKLKISSYGKYLRQLIRKNHLEGKVIFLGRLDAEEMKKQYLDSQLYLCPSILENSPNSLGEAMLLGVPCVAAAVGGIPSLLSEKEGILFEGGNPEALAQAVLRMWQDEVTQREHTRHARIRALCNHDADGNYHTLMRIYEKIMAGDHL